ncbi:hypothetical protein [Furfurilactobacillus siliginis]|nr:hypothetical protein [Furfurilactobacillus siliginis]GEK29666.1 hypothetical protein LSI01_19770 [Furfurilactobacillus siliginis]
MKKVVQFGVVALSAFVLAGCSAGSNNASNKHQESESTRSSQTSKASATPSSAKSASNDSNSSQSSMTSSSVTSGSSSTAAGNADSNAQTASNSVAINSQTDALNALVAQYGTNNGDTAYAYLGSSTINGQLAYNFDGFSKTAMQSGQRGQTGAFYVFADGRIVNTFDNPNGLN